MKRILLLLVLAASPVAASDFKPIVLDPTYEHDKWVTQPVDIGKDFRAYTSSFDSADDDDGDGTADVWGIPHWVAYEIKQHDPLGKAPDRPSQWITDTALHAAGIMPDDSTYSFSVDFRHENPLSPMLGYDRGHLCMKQHAFRLGPAADWNTHTFYNCVPQAADFNRGIWRNLEDMCAAWADKYGRIWVIDGPVVYGMKPILYLSKPGEVAAAVPDALFKIVVREIEGQDPAVLAFIYPQRGLGYRSGPFDHRPFLTSVQAIQYFTKLDFLTELPDDVEARTECAVATELWP